MGHSLNLLLEHCTFCLERSLRDKNIQIFTKISLVELNLVLVSHVDYSKMRACSVRYSAVRVYSPNRYSTLKEVVSIYEIYSPLAAKFKTSENV